MWTLFTECVVVAVIGMLVGVIICAVLGVPLQFGLILGAAGVVYAATVKIS